MLSLRVCIAEGGRNQGVEQDRTRRLGTFKKGGADSKEKWRSFCGGEGESEKCEVIGAQEEGEA